MRNLLCIIFAIMMIPACGHSGMPKRKADVIRVPGIDPKVVHRKLENAGFEPGQYNEHDLTQLSEAIRRFQKVAKLRTDGVLGEETWPKLKQLYDPSESASAPVRSSPPPKGSMRTSPSGMQWPSGIMQTIRKILSDQGYDAGADISDPRFREAVREFQRRNNLSPDGELNSDTTLSIIKNACKQSCEFRFRISETDIKALAAVPDSDISKFSGTVVETIYFGAFRNMLKKLGYDPGTVDGTLDTATMNAIRQYQRNRNIVGDGKLTRETALSVFSEGCGEGCDFQFSVNIRKTEQKIRKVDTPRIGLDYPVNINDKVFAIEKLECSKISGDWVLFYEGTVTGKNDDSVSLRLEKRIGYYFHPDKEGVDERDWWCIPRKKHCYSEVKFSDWNGKYAANQIANFPAERVYNAKITIINGISEFIRKNCGQ